MKKILLIGTTLFSAASYVSAMDNNQKDSKTNARSEELGFSSNIPTSITDTNALPPLPTDRKSAPSSSDVTESEMENNYLVYFLTNPNMNIYSYDYNKLNEAVNSLSNWEQAVSKIFEFLQNNNNPLYTNVDFENLYFKIKEVSKHVTEERSRKFESQAKKAFQKLFDIFIYWQKAQIEPELAAKLLKDQDITLDSTNYLNLNTISTLIAQGKGSLDDLIRSQEKNLQNINAKKTFREIVENVINIQHKLINTKADHIPPHETAKKMISIFKTNVYEPLKKIFREVMSLKGKYSGKSLDEQISKRKMYFVLYSKRETNPFFLYYQTIGSLIESSDSNRNTDEILQDIIVRDRISSNVIIAINNYIEEDSSTDIPTYVQENIIPPLKDYKGVAFQDLLDPIMEWIKQEDSHLTVINNRRNRICKKEEIPTRIKELTEDFAKHEKEIEEIHKILAEEKKKENILREYEQNKLEIFKKLVFLKKQEKLNQIAACLVESHWEILKDALVNIDIPYNEVKTQFNEFRQFYQKYKYPIIEWLKTKEESLKQEIKKCNTEEELRTKIEERTKDLKGYSIKIDEIKKEICNLDTFLAKHPGWVAAEEQKNEKEKEKQVYITLQADATNDIKKYQNQIEQYLEDRIKADLAGASTPSES